MHLSTKARLVTPLNKGRRYDSQTTDKNDDVKKEEVDGKQERAEAKVDLDEQKGELRNHANEDDELAKARDEQRDNQHEQVGAVIVHRRHGALAVPRAREQARQLPIRAGEQCDDLVAGPTNSGH